MSAFSFARWHIVGITSSRRRGFDGRADNPSLWSSRWVIRRKRWYKSWRSDNRDAGRLMRPVAAPHNGALCGLHSAARVLSYYSEIEIQILATKSFPAWRENKAIQGRLLFLLLLISESRRIASDVGVYTWWTRLCVLGGWIEAERETMCVVGTETRAR